MEKDVLVILMMAFGLFAILMFILFYIYARKHYNEKHIDEEYDALPNDESDEIELKETKKEKKTIDNDELDYIPKKK